jgi:hypothetical protein
MQTQLGTQSIRREKDHGQRRKTNKVYMKSKVENSNLGVWAEVPLWYRGNLPT